jgi:hypothetical protein
MVTSNIPTAARTLQHKRLRRRFAQPVLFWRLHATMIRNNG